MLEPMPRDSKNHTYLLFDINTLISYRISKYFFQPAVNQTTLAQLKGLLEQGYRFNNCIFSMLSQVVDGQIAIEGPRGHIRFFDPNVIISAIQTIVALLVKMGAISFLQNENECPHNVFYNHDKDGIIFIFYDKEPSKILLFSDNDGVINAAKKYGCTTIRTHNYADLDQVGLKRLELCPLLPYNMSPKRIVLELDVDDTLLAFEFTFLSRIKALNHSVINFLKELRRIYFDAEIIFNIITSRVPEHEMCGKECLLINSIVEEMRNIKELYFEINNTSFVQKINENGKRVTLCAKVDDIYQRAKEESIKNTVYIFLDDDPKQIIRALKAEDKFKKLGTEIIPIQIHRSGDLTGDALEALMQHSLLSTHTNETLKNLEQRENTDTVANRPA